MNYKPYTYIIYIQYLGIRYHGWQIQPGVKTIQGILTKNFRYVIGPLKFTLLGGSRTDAGVSCNRGAFQLFCESPLELPPLLEKMNKILPDDIRLLDAEPVPLDFNIIHGIELKEYAFNFSFGEKFHPFVAANLVFFSGYLDIDSMKEAAREFTGAHDFRRYCSQDKITDNYIRYIDSAELTSHPHAGISNLPKESYTFKVSGKGFLRYQIRIMMAALVEVGRGNLSLEALRASLLADEKIPIASPVPAYGLVLENIIFKK